MAGVAVERSTERLSGIRADRPTPSYRRGHRVSFVSVTQQFNTTTSRGRLTLNVLLSFAQFEREVTSERIRDKIAASKRKGLWVGGPLPLGYHMKDDKIAVVEDEAERVRLIYRRYLELGGVNALLRDLRKRDSRRQR
jgi:DNA invertase Pin-like site-specific DNA recombinase